MLKQDATNTLGLSKETHPIANQFIEQQKRLELVNFLYKQVKFPLAADIVVATVLFFILFNVSNFQWLGGWYLFALSGSVIRFVLMKFYERANKEHANLKKWEILFIMAVAWSGISWGILGSLLMPPGKIMYQAFIIFSLIGVTAFAASFYSSVRNIYPIFLSLALFPLTAWSFLQIGNYNYLGIIATAYVFVMLTTSSYLQNFISQLLKLHIQNVNLSKALHDIHQTLDKRVEERTGELEKSLSMVKAAIESNTDGILVLNAKNKIEAYNQRLLEIWRIPTELMQDYDRFIAYIKNQLDNASSFSTDVNEVNKYPERESFDELHLQDGRFIECYSTPQQTGLRSAGRVWSFRDITSRKHLEDQLVKQATYDVLTGLPNRALLLDRLTQAMIYAKRLQNLVAVFFLDLDRFKLINDNYGHACGDSLLKEVAKRLKTCLRESDTVARLGGDEFVMVFAALQAADEAIPLAQRVQVALAGVFYIEGHELAISTSIGISFFPNDSDDATALLKNADLAMYSAKEIGRNNFQFYTEEMNKRSLERLELEVHLRKALERKEFCLHYQPIINLTTGKIIGVEALIRWFHPELNYIPPAKFIPLAEETGFIIPIGEWVLQEACLQNKRWQEQNLPPIRMSVNVSGVQFKKGYFVESVSRILEETKLQPHYLELEMTESILMHDADATTEILYKLKSMGVDLAIDDFGTGYSSLSYLKRFPVDKLKIDRSFVKELTTNPEDAVIVMAIIAMAKKLQVNILAEGVENINQLTFLKDQGCNECQGYYFSQPLSAETCTKLLKENRIYLEQWLEKNIK